MKSSPEQEHEQELTTRENRLREELKDLEAKRLIVLQKLGECLVERIDGEDQANV